MDDPVPKACGTGYSGCQAGKGCRAGTSPLSLPSRRTVRAGTCYGEQLGLATVTALGSHKDSKGKREAAPAPANAAGPSKAGSSLNPTTAATTSASAVRRQARAEWEREVRARQRRLQKVRWRGRIGHEARRRVDRRASGIGGRGQAVLRSTVRNPALPIDESGVFDERAAFRYRLQYESWHG